MRKAFLLLASMTLAVSLACGVAFAAVVSCVEGEVLCLGTEEADTLNGSEQRDTIRGLAGDDELLGNGGDDDLLGGGGDDTMRGGEGVDALSYKGKQGADKVYGEGGWDYLDDTSLHCTRRRGRIYDRNLLDGGDGNDWLLGHAKLYGGPGDDQLFGSDVYPGERAGPRTIVGGPGNDYIDSGQTEDTIYARDGERDQIRCGGKTDTVYYDAGIDAVSPVSCERRITQPPPDVQ